MANWNNKITLEVKLPYITQGCTLDYLKAIINVTPGDIWIGIDDCKWTAEIYYGDEYRLLIKGKCTAKGIDKNLETIWQPTTYKVHAYGTHDGIRPNDTEYKCRVVLWE